MKLPEATRHVGQGAAMGVADLVPGVSGGTVAFLLGIHPRLVRAVAAWGVQTPGTFLRALRRADDADARAAARRHDVTFLLPLGLGLLAAIFLGANVVHRALEQFPVLAMALFAGLLAASVPVPWRRIVRHDARTISAAVAATLLAATLAWVPTAQITLAWPGLIFVGAIAVTAMLLPGISGSGLLLLMGAYDAVLGAAANLDLTILAPFAAGAVFGLLAASRLLRWLFDRHADVTLAALTGLVAGAIARVWPWRSQPGFAAGAPRLPDNLDGDFWLPVASAATGAFVVVATDWLVRRRAVAASAEVVE